MSTETLVPLPELHATARAAAASPAIRKPLLVTDRSIFTAVSPPSGRILDNTPPAVNDEARQNRVDT